jgi:hypothetical protein
MVGFLAAKRIHGEDLNQGCLWADIAPLVVA